MTNFNLISIITEKCNFECPHCSTSSSPRAKGIIPKEVLFEVLEDFSNIRENKSHLVSGGEPTLYSGLKDVLNCSKDLGYDTGVVTNASWVDASNVLKSEKLFEKFFPEGVGVFASLDYYHLKEDSHLEEKVSLLAKMCKDRNKFSVDGAYDGKAGLKKVLSLVDNRWDFNPIQLQKMGRGKFLPNSGVLDESKLYCPKSGGKGFALVPDGSYYCFRGALNKTEKLKICDGYDFEKVREFLDTYSSRQSNKMIKKKYFSGDISGDNHVCDICEKF